MGATLRKKLTGLHGKYPQVLTEVRGIGLMLGLKCAIANTTLIRRLMDNGLLSVPAADNVVRLLPPLIVGEEEIDEAVAIIDRSCAELAETAT
jgi:acetylornithine/N-succinyldiaminopimelate aminotransferase